MRIAALLVLLSILACVVGCERRIHEARVDDASMRQTLADVRHVG